MRKATFLKLGSLALGLALSIQAWADTGLKLPPYYSVELVDGMDDGYNFDKSTRTLNLTPGRHQVVVLFEGNFGTQKDSKLVQAADPIVIDIFNLENEEVLSFSYQIPNTIEKAEKYARTQLIELNDGKKRISPEKASYFVLQSEVGFSLIRDYRHDLMSVNRLYAPNYVDGTNRTIGMTEYGAPAITATAGASMGGYSAPQNITMPSPGVSMAQNQTMATSAVGGGNVGASAVTLNQLISLYNSADDKTRLEFVKYVMSH